MKTLQDVITLAAVAGGLAVIALRMFRLAEVKRRSGPRWLLVLFGTWLGVLAAAAFGVRSACAHHFKAMPGFWIVFAPAVALAFGAALILDSRLARLTARPESRRKKARPSEKLPPPPAVTTFKFSCPDCGQRIAVTSEHIGTKAQCPSCQSPLIVPPSPIEPVTVAGGHEV